MNEKSQLSLLSEMCTKSGSEEPILHHYMNLVGRNATQSVAQRFLEEKLFLSFMGSLCIVVGVLGVTLNFATFSYYCNVKKHLFSTAYRSLTICDMTNCFAAILMGCNLIYFISWDATNMDRKLTDIILSELVVAISSLMSRIAVWYNLILTVLRTQTVVTPSSSMSARLLKWILVVQPVFWLCITIADVSLQFSTRLPFLFHIRYDVIRPMLGRLTILQIGISTCSIPHPLLIWFISLVIPFILPVLIAFPLMIGQVYCLMFRNRQISAKSARSKKMTITIIYLTLLYIISNSVHAIVIGIVTRNPLNSERYENYLFITSTLVPYLHSTINAGILIRRGHSLQNHCLALLDRYIRRWWRQVETPVRDEEGREGSNRNMTTCQGERDHNMACSVTPMNPGTPVAPVTQKSRESSL